MTLPLRVTQANATAAAEHPCAAPIRASVGSPTTSLLSPPSGEYAITGMLCILHQDRRSRSIRRLLRL